MHGMHVPMEERMEKYEGKYRHELKYMMDERDVALTVSRIRQFMQPDAHYPEGKYRIRSVYFDDIWDTAYMQNLNGVSPRSKYRIRIYNEKKDMIHLEQKIKNHDMTGKKSCLLSVEECDGFLRGRTGRFLQEDTDGLLVDFKRKILWDYLRPKVIVEYERTAFTYKEGNVRVTFDGNLASSGYIGRLWEKELPRRPVMAGGKYVMEVKYDEFLPGCVRQALDTGKMERTRFSKYTLCRMKGAVEK